MEGLIFGGAYLRKEICASKLTGLALYALYLRVIFQVQAPGGLIFGGAI